MRGGLSGLPRAAPPVIDQRLQTCTAARSPIVRTGSGPASIRSPRELTFIALGFIVYAVAVFAVATASVSLIPDQVVIGLPGRLITVHSVHRRILSNLALTMITLPCVLMVECAVVGWRASSLRDLLFKRTASSCSDIACFVIWQTHFMSVLALIMTLGLTLLPGFYVHGALSALLGRSISIAVAPLWAQVAVIYFSYTFLDYWGHRLDHGRVLWPLHRFHHAAEGFCVVNSVRTHPASFSNVFCLALPLAFLGASPEAMAVVSVIVAAHGYLIHSRIDSNFGWFGRYVMQSPNHHRLHHILDISKTPVGHFALAPIWDHLFGTWRGDADQTLVIGVDTPYRNGFWVGSDILRDYWDFWRTLTGQET